MHSRTSRPSAFSRIRKTIRNIIPAIRSRLRRTNRPSMYNSEPTAVLEEDQPKPMTNKSLRTAIKEYLENKENAIQTYGNISDWNVSAVTNMSFLITNQNFNEDISKWDVSNVTDMSAMFASSSFNQPLNDWNVSNVTNMRYMFDGATSFNQPLKNWNVSNVTDMGAMFDGAISFNQPLNDWNVSNVTNMKYMFDDARSFNQPLNNWNVSNVTDMSSMFYIATAFNQPLNDWNVSNVTDMNHMFDGATSFNQPLNNWDVSNVTNMEGMFDGAISFNQPLNNWDVRNVTDMSDMFSGTHYNQPLNKWNLASLPPSVSAQNIFPRTMLSRNMPKFYNVDIPEKYEKLPNKLKHDINIHGVDKKLEDMYHPQKGRTHTRKHRPIHLSNEILSYLTPAEIQKFRVALSKRGGKTKRKTQKRRKYFV